jgi:hypothetical protein
MLVFGGKTYRNLIGANGQLLFENCEQEDLDNTPLGALAYTCGEQLLNDMWRYHIKRQVWSYIKPDYNREIYSEFIRPSARYGHAAVYAEEKSLDRYANQIVLRKYIYIYGGLSHECVDACSDFWRYEIPWAAQRYYPAPKQGGSWWNRGNHWTLLSNDTSISPGKRYFHAMQIDYNQKTIYLFGGISCNDSICIYMNDVWKYYIQLAKWESIAEQGISSIYRNISLWDGTIIYRNVTPIEMLVFFLI